MDEVGSLREPQALPEVSGHHHSARRGASGASASLPCALLLGKGCAWEFSLEQAGQPQPFN